MARVSIYDTTLRDGSQGEGVNFSLQDKLLLTRRLDEIGVDYVEGGYPLSNPRDFHVTNVLGTTLDENLKMIADSVAYCKGQGREVFYDAEHFFDGYRANPEYALQTLRTAGSAGAKVVILCDTNGG